MKMKSCVLFTVAVFLLINKTFGKNNNFKDVRKGKHVEPRYQFNHPPSVEYYNPIPVAIVYEDNNYKSKSGIPTVNESKNNSEERKSKAVELNGYYNHPPSAEYNDTLPVSIVFEDKNYSNQKNITTDTKAAENVNVSATKTEKNETKNEPKQDIPEIDDHSKNNIKVEEKRQHLDDWQIPVAVVYETDNSSYQNHQKRKTETSEAPRLRSNSSRKIEADYILQNNQNGELENDKTPSGVNTKVYKKRVGDRDPVVPILEMESYVFSHNGNFHYSYEGGDGTKAYSEGKQKTINDEAGESVVGGFSYTDKEGNDYSLTYTADENGYRPVGAHLPTPPPIPPAIARALAYLATATPEPVTKKPEKIKP